MDDQNVFAILTAKDSKNKASSAFKLPHNSKWFCKAVEGIVAEESIIGSREATPAGDEDAQTDEEDRLVITFNEVESPVNGIQLGTSRIFSHILLGRRGTRGISAKQCNITVDNNFRIWLHDYYSSHGTAVEYNGQNHQEVRTKETWILAYQAGTPNQLGDIRIHLSGLIVKVEFPNHEKAHPRYLEYLSAFIKRCKKAAEESQKTPAVETLGLQSEATTQTPSEAQTLGERFIYVKDKGIGNGAFGQVFKLIRARDGKFFAGKFFASPINKRRRGEPDPIWLTEVRREFALMKENPHVRISAVRVALFSIRDAG